MIDILEAVGYFKRSISTFNNPVYSVFIFNFGHCKVHFMHITLRMRVSLKSQCLIVDGAKPFPANQNVKYKCYHCDLQIFHIFAGSIYVCLCVYVWMTIQQTYTGSSAQTHYKDKWMLTDHKYDVILEAASFLYKNDRTAAVWINVIRPMDKATSSLCWHNEMLIWILYDPFRHW